MNEYVGYKIERKDNAIKMTQPVLVQSLEDEFELPEKISDNLPVLSVLN